MGRKKKEVGPGTRTSRKNSGPCERKLSATPLGHTGRGQRPKYQLEEGDVEIKLSAGSVWIVKRLCRGCLRYFWQSFEPNIQLRKERCVDCVTRTRWVRVAATSGGKCDGIGNT